MRVPATPGWVSLSVVVAAPRHSWLRAPGAVCRHSWRGSAGGGGVWPLATPRCGSRWWFPATPGLGAPLVAVLGGPLPLLAEGLVGGSPPLLAGVRRPRRWVFPRVGLSRVVCACGAACACGACAGACGVCSWCLCWWWCGCGRAFRVRLCVCVRACVVCWWCVLWCGVVCWLECGWCVVWLVPRNSWQRYLCATFRRSWLGFAAGGGGRSSPLLAEGPGCGSPPLLAGVRQWWWFAAPRHSWLRSAAVRWWLAPCHSWRWGLVAGPRHSWLGSAAGCRGWSLATPGRGPWLWFPATPGWGPLVVMVGALGALLLRLGVCVCAVWRFVLVWAAEGGGRARCGCRVCACVCVLCLVGGLRHTLVGSCRRSACPKAEEEKR